MNDDTTWIVIEIVCGTGALRIEEYNNYEQARIGYEYMRDTESVESIALATVVLKHRKDCKPF